MTPARHFTRDGITVGLIAYASVAVFYSLFDLLAARGTLFTVNLLGRAVFGGLRDPAILMLPIPLDLTAIFWYNALHFLLSLAIGLVVTRLVEQAERNQSQALPILFVILGGFLTTILAVGWLTTSVRPVLPWWSIVVANALATLMAARYLLRRRPGLLGRFFAFAA